MADRPRAGAVDQRVVDGGVVVRVGWAGAGTGVRVDGQVVFDRGVLRRPVARDVERIAEICQDVAIQRFTRVPIPYGVEDAEGFVTTTNERWESGQPATWIVEVDGVLVGNVGLVAVDRDDGWGELGYWTAPEARRRGLMVAAARAACDWVFAHTSLERLELQIAAGNEGSVAVARRLGFVQEGVRRSAAVLRATGDLPEVRVDMAVWGMLRDEWEQAVDAGQSG